MIQNILSIFIALGVLITFHEFGHYYIARRCGVKVLRFSVGFGKPIYSYINKQGTQFTLALIPLGGYVRMLDEREGDVTDELKSQAFNNKSVWQRIAIVAAGPIANFLLAIILYAVVALQGIQAVSPIVASTINGSPAANTALEEGDELTAINGERVSSWQQTNLALASLIGSSENISIRYLRPDSSVEVEEYIKLNAWLVNKEPSDLIAAFGITIKRPLIPAIVHDLVDDGAAQIAGFKVNDKVVQINGNELLNWPQFVDIIQQSPLQKLDIVVLRNNREETLSLIPQQRENNGVVQGYVGIMVAPIELDQSWYRVVEYNVFEALVYGIDKTEKMVSLTLGSIGKMLQGLISIENLSGPITIAKVASASAESGLQSFLQFLAYLSVSLGVLNLLPIPVLDGGHLAFYSIEAIRRKPVPEKIQHLAYKIGASLLFALMAVAIFNDIARL